MPRARPEPITRRNLRSIAIIAALLLIATLGWLGIQAYAAAHPGNVAVVTDGDGVIYELSLNQDSKTVITSSLGTNTVLVENGHVQVQEANCPGGDCVEHDAINQMGQTIICLPNHLVITIDDAQDSPDPVFDTINQ